nr:branched-chain amino acid ABC transporter permease [Demequina litorisediminis]
MRASTPRPQQRPPNPATTDTSNRLVNGLVFGLLLALASVGLSLIYGTTGLSNFAHGEQVSLGALLCFFFTTQQPVSLPLIPVEFTIGWPLIPSAIAAIAVAAGTGWLQDKFLWSPLRRRRVSTVQQMIVSIGLSLALVNFIQWWFGAERQRLSTSIDSRIDMGIFTIGQSTLWSLAISLACLGGVAYFLMRTRTGRATRAVSDNPALASASGIRVDKVVRLVWILATGLAAVGGILLALYDNAAAFDVGARLLLLMFAAVTLGGLGHPFGALVGSLVIGVAVEMSTIWVGTDLKYAVALGILILVLLVRPQGILGRAERVG